MERTGHSQYARSVRRGCVCVRRDMIADVPIYRTFRRLPFVQVDVLVLVVKGIVDMIAVSRVDDRGRLDRKVQQGFIEFLLLLEDGEVVEMFVVLVPEVDVYIERIEALNLLGASVFCHSRLECNRPSRYALSPVSFRDDSRLIDAEPYIRFYALFIVGFPERYICIPERLPVLSGEVMVETAVIEVDSEKVVEAEHLVYLVQRALVVVKRRLAQVFLYRLLILALFIVGSFVG